MERKYFLMSDVLEKTENTLAEVSTLTLLT